MAQRKFTPRNTPGTQRRHSTNRPGKWSRLVVERIEADNAMRKARLVAMVKAGMQRRAAASEGA